MEKTDQWVAFIRGINVTGRNVDDMALPDRNFWKKITTRTLDTVRKPPEETV